MPEREPQDRILNQTISRRDLLKGAAILAGGTLITEACGEGIKEFSVNAENSYPLVWQTEYDSATSIFKIISKQNIEVILSFDDEHFERSIIEPRSGREVGRFPVKRKEVWRTGPGFVWVPELEELKIPGIMHTGLTRDSWDLLPEGYIYPDLYGDVVIARSTETEGKVLDYDYYAGFDKETGEMLWKKKFGFNGRFYFNETGLYDTGGENAKFGSYILNIEIRKIDLYTGKQYWKKENVTKSEVAVPLWSDNNNLVVVSNHDVISLNNQNGKIFGKIKFDGPVFMFDPFPTVNDFFEDYEAAVGNKKVFLPIFSRLVELNKTSGVLTYVDAPLGQSVSMSDHLLIVGVGSDLYAYNTVG